MEEIQSAQPDKQAAKPSRAELLKKLSPSLLLAGVLGWVFSMPGVGLCIIYIILVQGIAVPVRLYKSRNAPVEWKLTLARAVVWVFAVLVIYSIHTWRDAANRRNADEIVDRVVAYSASHGSCATSIEDVGMSRTELKDKLGSGAFYYCKDGKQALFYRSSFVAFDSWVYDFERHEWRYFAG